MTNRIIQTRRGFVVASVSFVGLAGCGHLLEPENQPGTIYVLAPDLPASSGGAHLPFQLVVTRPEASASLATERIALRRGAVLDYYAGSQWTDTAPLLIQNLLVQALEKSGALSGVAKDVAGLRADYTLESELRSFDARYDTPDGAPTVEVAVAARLIASHNAAVAATKEFRHEAPASANSVAAAVAAFDQATAAVLADIVHWVLEMMARA